MTRDEELAALISEQGKEDTHMCPPERINRQSILSLDRIRSDSEFEVAGLVYDMEDMISRGDHHAQGAVVTGGNLTPHARKGAGSLVSIPHGTYNGANNYGCRCEGCADAYRKYNRDYMRRYGKRRRRKVLAARAQIACRCCDGDFTPRVLGAKFCSNKCAWRAGQRRLRGVPESDSAFSKVRVRKSAACR